MDVLHATCGCLAGREEDVAVKEAAMLVVVVVSGHYLGVWTGAFYDEKVCVYGRGIGLNQLVFPHIM